METWLDCRLLGRYALDEDVHDAAADLVFAFRGLGEVDGHEAGLARLMDTHGFLPDLGFAATTADRAAEAAVRADGHLCARLPRRRSSCGGYGGNDQRLAFLDGLL
jgi:hypothetical protein